jgi:protease IV
MRDFFKHTLATLLGLFIFLGISVGGLLALVIVAASSAKDPGPQVKNKSVLVFDLAQSISDAEPESSPQDLINGALSGSGGKQNLTLRNAVHAIDAAAKDKRILALYMASPNTAAAGATGYANLKEVREALVRFKQSGKKIYAYNVDWQKRDYYLASVADELAVNPMGSLEITGLSAETTYYAGALEKFGVGVQAIWRGKYKSAVEPFLRTKRSDASREQTAKLLNDIWGEFIQATSDGRQLPAAELKSITENQGYLSAQDAKAKKLVDRTAYADEMLDQLKQLTGEDGDTKAFRQISLRSYANAIDDQINPSSGEQVAVVYAEGEIVNGQGAPGSIGGDRFARQLRQLRLDPKVKAVVLRVNSPGGSSTASEVIQREVILTKKTKPIVVSMGSTAASGGYWISTYADRIFAEPNTITGSIGVFGLQPNFQKLANDNGITWDVVKTGKFADSRTLTRPKSPEEIAVIQKIVGQIYDQFLAKVAESRQLAPAKVAEIAQGRVWSGAEAKKLGLVDELGGLDAAIGEAAKRAKLGNNWHVEEYPESKSFEGQLFKSLIGTQASTQAAVIEDPISAELQKIQADLSSLRSLNDPRGIYMRLPDNFRIN